MSNLQKAMNCLDDLLSAPTAASYGTKIYEPLPGDPGTDIKLRLINFGVNAMRLGKASLEGIIAPVPMLENKIYFELDALPDSDAEKRDFFELFNATQAVLSTINEGAA